MMETIGIIHPGAMGVSVAAGAQAGGNRVRWASEGRSPATLGRALEHGLEDARSVEALCAACTVLISVCPPAAAETVADSVRAHGFAGLYVDANAIAPKRAIRIADQCRTAGIEYVDGGIIGGPAWNAGTTRLYLSGALAGRVAGLFAGSPLEAVVLDEVPGTASALKMCYAAYTKGTTALLSAILAASESLGVREALAAEWSRDGSDFAEIAEKRAARVTAKAWRFAGEMDEIVATFRAEGLPAGFHEAAGEIYRRLEGFKDAPDLPDLALVLDALLRKGAESRKE